MDHEREKERTSGAFPTTVLRRSSARARCSGSPFFCRARASRFMAHSVSTCLMPRVRSRWSTARWKSEMDSEMDFRSFSSLWGVCVCVRVWLDCGVVLCLREDEGGVSM